MAPVSPRPSVGGEIWRLPPAVADDHSLETKCFSNSTFTWGLAALSKLWRLNRSGSPGLKTVVSTTGMLALFLTSRQPGPGLICATGPLPPGWQLAGMLWLVQVVIA